MTKAIFHPNPPNPFTTPWILLAVKILLVVVIILLLPKLVMSEKDIDLFPWVLLVLKIIAVMVIIFVLPKLITAEKGVPILKTKSFIGER
mmetsp:Transcript_26904/g.38606  ORF Transcript_26904/g.38606 Transcript_26904/m.38606 type:complete len:90 (-) Transcript_26904:119-388(-)